MRLGRYFTRFVQGLLIAVAGACAALALAAQAWISVPSAVLGKAVTVKGGSLGSWAAVTIKMLGPAGDTSLVATADANGSLSVEIPAGVAGTYKIEVFDAAGQRLGQGTALVQ